MFMLVNTEMYRYELLLHNYPLAYDIRMNFDLYIISKLNN